MPDNIGAAASSQDLLAATRPYARESVWWSWWSVWSTFAVLAVLLTWTVVAPWWPIQILASLLAGGVIVRGFILYHDFLHGAILKKSPLARFMLSLFGMLLLVPPNSWRKSHNHHHAHVGKLDHSHVGSFPLMTTEQWRQASFGRKLVYRISRHPITLMCAYATVFFANICVMPFFRNPSKHWDSVLALVLHAVVIVALLMVGGFWMYFTTMLLPLVVASAAGAYLFYVQHNTPGLEMYAPDDEYDHAEASLKSSGYLALDPVSRWFSGNIGFHHIHHLNHKIPFYRLPEVMRAIPALQDVKRSSPWPWHIWSSLRIQLWDAEARQLVKLSAA